MGNNTWWSCVIPPRIKKSKSCGTTNHKKKNRRFQLKKIPTSSNQNNNEAGEIFTPDLHFSRISTANQEKEPAISIEENTNFIDRHNQMNRRYQLKKIQLQSTGKITTTTKQVKYSRLIYTSAGLVLQIKKKNRRYQLKKIPTSSTGTIKWTGDINWRKSNFNRPAKSKQQRSRWNIHACFTLQQD